MSIVPTDILAVSKALASSGLEPDLRSSISRAYYAAFHSVLRALPDEFEPDTRSASSHEAVVSSAKAYSRTFRPGRTAAAGIADALPRLKKRRKTADYELDEDVNNPDAQSAIALAEKIITLANDLSSKSSVQATGSTP